MGREEQVGLDLIGIFKVWSAAAGLGVEKKEDLDSFLKDNVWQAYKGCVFEVQISDKRLVVSQSWGERAISIFAVDMVAV